MRGVSNGSLYGVSVLALCDLVFARGLHSRNGGSGALLVLGCQSISLTIELRYSSIGQREAGWKPGFSETFSVVLFSTSFLDVSAGLQVL